MVAKKVKVVNVVGGLKVVMTGLEVAGLKNKVAKVDFIIGHLFVTVYIITNGESRKGRNCLIGILSLWDVDVSLVGRGIVIRLRKNYKKSNL